MRAVVVPATPLLLPAYASRVDPIPELRAAARDAVLLLEDPAVLAVPDLVSSRPVGDVVPWGLQVGRALLPSRPRREVVGEQLWTGDPKPVRGGAPLADVLLVADGSARRQEEGGPGTFDARAEAFDASIATALEVGDAAALAGLDEDLGAQLLAAGVPWFRWLGNLGKPVRTELSYAAAPYGVGYFVALWEW